MAESMLSAILPMLIEKLVSETSNSIAHYKGIGAEIEKCQSSLKLIQGVLTDASQKEITNQAVKVWLNDLQHLAYDIDDVLDGWATDAMSREVTHDSEAFTSKVRKLLPSCCTNFSPNIKMHDKLDYINPRLERLVKQKDLLGLNVGGEIRRRNNNRRSQSSVYDPSTTTIVGRQDEKEALVQQLLSGEPCDKNYSIVPIVGMGGVGKTTLARLLYNDEQVNDHFTLKAWVCVSDDFLSIFAISKVIFQSVTGESKHSEDFNQLQEDLLNHLRGERFLLVLDDVWSESYADWETLVRPFHVCAPGSKIIITTRKEQLLKQLGCCHLNQLQTLTHDDALSLFALHALGVNNFDAHLSLKPHGEAIVKKCDRLPLALITLGKLLRTKEDEASWMGVLESEIWEVEGGIIPTLRLSYHDLSRPLKQLFAYCSLFPKDFLFDKEDLVLLWMAEGFLHQPSPSDETEEDLGHNFFNELLSRSFFQHAPNNESLFVMHDLMNDLATSVATEFFIRLGNENEKNIRTEMLEKCRHMSFVREKYVTYKKFEAFDRAKSLRTFLASSVGVIGKWDKFYLSNKILVDLVCRLPLLRVLSLSDFDISEIPDSIGTLKHLKYLNLSRTKITHLPKTFCNLYNLQTLILSGCHCLASLPSSFLKLKNLRHLEIRDTPVLNQLPLGIAELKSLQTLSKIVIGGEMGFEIAKLKELKNLYENVSIMGLENVQTTIDAEVANFSQKRLTKLDIVRSQPSSSGNENLEEEVLNKLKPCYNKLIQLNFFSYGGSEFPKWVGDPLFLHLKHVSISGCKRCTSLPPLGQLPSLKELFIEGLHGVEDVDFKLSGAEQAFPSLEILSFKDMRGWKKWYGVVLPCLQSLEIEYCPNLLEVKLEAMASLNVLGIYNCPNLVELSLEALPSLNDLTITKCDSDVLRRMVKVASTITMLEISDIASLNDCPNLVELPLEALPSLNVLTIYKCDSGVLRTLVEVASAVTKLDIRDISGLNDVVWRGVINCLGAVEELNIENCNEIRYLVKSASKVLVKLRNLVVRHCDNLVSIGEKEEEDNCRSNLLPSLRILKVTLCENMERCICPDGIEVLNVCRCKNMECCICPDGIEELKVSYCGSMTVVSFPKGGQEKLRSLKIIGCSKLLERELGGQQMNNNNRSSMPMLAYLWIFNWPNLKSINELNCCVHLTELRIYDCESLESFPDNLTSLKELEIRKCPKLDGSFLGNNLTSLENLQIMNCTSMDASLPGWVWPPNLRFLMLEKLKKPFSEWGPQKKLPTSLVELELYGTGEDGVDSWSQISHILPSSLTSLQIYGFKKLESVSTGLQHLTSLQSLSFVRCPNLNKVCWDPQHLKLESVSTGFQHLTSLQSLCFGNCPNLNKVCWDPQHLTSLHHLTFEYCPNMMDLPEMFPSLLSLSIFNCPILRERCSKNESYWSRISHIPCIRL